MIFRQFLNEPLSAASYLIGCVATGEAAVVDPSLPAEDYILAAADKGLKITKVIETHFHADYFSTGRAIAALTGATIYAPSRDDIQGEATSATVLFDHVRVNDGDKIQVGNITLTAIHTPGHTPEHMSYAISDNPRAERPWMVLTGDCLFVNDVGRTDLVNLPMTGNDVMFESVQKLLALPDDCEIFPAHYGGSACGGKNMSGKTSSTIGFERRFNWMLQARTKEEFARLAGETPRRVVEAVLRHRNTNRGALPLPEALTEQGVASAVRAPALTIQQAYEATQTGAVLIDLRKQMDFAAGHPRGAINVTYHKDKLINRVSAVTAPGEPLIFISDVPVVAATAAALWSSQASVQRNPVLGYVREPVQAWAAAGLPTATLPVGSLEDLHAHAQAADAVILDVREPFEWANGVIPNGKTDVRLISLGNIRNYIDALPRDRKIVVTCESGTRASAVCSLLVRHGFSDLLNIAPEGMSDYTKRYPTVVPAAS
ncbi:MAG: MBL fold metallo-hydrolase [Anaerolineae bacterium]|nr:MBL fold metallo-hydrolase [Candidatus Roseilinea sp.]MDW8448465.1 MBL fold metallo-hydrolase [Anaerolineae bacterium]